MVTSTATTTTTSSSPCSLLGSWTQHLHEYKKKYNEAQPFPHVVIENFWNEDFAKEILAAFPDPYKNRAGWTLYNNPLERKFANNDFSTFPQTIHRAYDVLQSKEFVELIREITGIVNIDSDPYLHGAGMHACPKNGKLDMHLDYSIHPTSGKERRVNLINYMSPDWDPSWGGSLDLYDHDSAGKMSKHIQRVCPAFNKICIFRTSDISYHGFPDPIECPEGIYRKSLAVYYVSPPRPEATHRLKAQFFARPTDEPNEGLEKLREIRMQRLITKEDIEKYVPGWNEALQW